MLIKKTTVTACQYDVTFHSYQAAAAFSQELSLQDDVFKIERTDTKVRFISVDPLIGEAWAKDFEERWIARLDAERSGAASKPDPLVPPPSYQEPYHGKIEDVSSLLK